MAHITDAMTPAEAARRTEDYRIHQEAAAESGSEWFEDSDGPSIDYYGFDAGVYPFDDGDEDY
jgi:hypothetical protein